jgi:Kef-type K+ transport system membrane component KefB
VVVLDVATIVAVPLALTPGRAARIAAGGVAVTAAAIAVYVVIHALRRNTTVARVRGYSRDRRWAFDLRLSLFVLFGLAALAARFGTSILVAGFAAGLIVAWAGEPERLSGQLLGVAEGFFVPLFFVTLGAQLNFRSLGSAPDRPRRDGGDRGGGADQPRRLLAGGGVAGAARRDGVTAITRGPSDLRLGLPKG